MTTAIQFDGISKQYRLGNVGTGTLSHDLERMWARLRGKPDPFAKVGQVNDRAAKSGDDGPDSKYVWALKDISFDVKEGEILGIIGRNGAGKSTLLKLLSRVTAPTTGAIRARGRIASLLEVGTGFHPELTGRENIYLNGAILGMRRREITRRLDEIIEFSGCAKYIDTPVKRYSSGMTVRLGFAVAAHLECEILVVDEVLAVGDAEFQKKCLGKLRSLSEERKRTAIFVSHNMAAVKHICTKGVVLGDGNITFVGDASDAIDHYQLTQSTNREIAIEDRIDRNGNGLVRINSIEITSNGCPTLYPDQPIAISVRYSKQSRELLSAPRLIVGIYDSFRNSLFRLDSALTDELPATLAPQGTIKCTVTPLHTTPGILFVNLAIFDNGQLADHVENAAAIEIEACYSNSGKLRLNRKDCLINLPHTWTYDD
ncbi:MAG: ABC transporter ATP-binding protein [Planctomycetales bacterium]|nr:ABC transporter ATP-binding protein [Planctomycetales bacterium]